MPFPIFDFQMLEAASLPKCVMENWHETARSNSREVAASLAPRWFKMYLQVFTAHIQRIRQDGAFFIKGCNGVQIRFSKAVPKKPSFSLFMAIAKWEHNQLLSRKWWEDW